MAMNIGKAVAEIRKKKGLRQKDLASQAGLSVNSLCNIETNKTFPQRETIQSLCKVLEIPPAYLLYFSVDIEDIPEDKRRVFLQLHDTIKKILLDEL